MNIFLESDLFTFLILPLLIMVSRLFDVTLGTLRIMFVSRGNKAIASVLGFFEILIWLIAIRQIMQNLDNVMCYIAYAGGFSLGNFMGIKIEEKLAYGKVIIRIITKMDASKLIKTLRDRGFGVTVINAEGISGPVKIIYSICDRMHIDQVVKTINRLNPKAFFTIEDVRAVNEGVFPSGKMLFGRIFSGPRPPRLFRRIRIFRRMFLTRKSK